MATTTGNDDATLGAVVIAPVDGDAFWPVDTRWRAAIAADGGHHPPERLLGQVKAVPLSSKTERALLEAIRSDDGRTVLEMASAPGEHRMAAATIAALRLAEDHPDRSLRLLAWMQQAPDDPANLRFLRRYLPGLRVMVRVDPELGVAIPLGRDAMGLLTAELLRTQGDPESAANVLASLTPSAPVALARASLRLSQGNLDGVHALARDRPIVDDVTIALRIVEADACQRGGDHARALASLEPALTRPDVALPVQRMGRGVRARALRSSGRDVEASLVDEGFGTSAPEPSSRKERPAPPEPPLFGRSLTDAIDDAFARVRRQELASEPRPVTERAEIDAECEQAIELLRSGHADTAEAKLLAHMDQVDAGVDVGGAVVEDYYVLLAGVFAQQGLTVEEVAVLERLRLAHERAGSEPSAAVVERLVEARSLLDGLG